MKLQVSVDLLSLDQAMNLLQDVAPYVDIIEAGTPLIKQEGLKTVETFKQAFPNKLIFADMKTMDAGELEAGIAFQAGADFTTVLAVSNDATIAGAVKAAKKYGKFVTADMIGVHDRLQRAKELQQLGVQYLEMHWGLDEQSNHHWDFSELRTLKETIKIPFAVAGGVNESTIEQVQASGADIVAIGGAIYHATSPKEAASRLRDKLAVLV